jgi:hypothetical protein
MTKALDDKLNTLDLSLFDQIESQTSTQDKRSLLALHAACREAFGDFTYLEIGSHLGGSLQSFIVDPLCCEIISIDPRPLIQPDERWTEGHAYPHNSTERMLALLRQLPDADLTRLRTIEKSTADISPAEIFPAPTLCFIDGEHTDQAALRDADFCRSVVRTPGVIAFHDRAVVGAAIRRFLRSTDGIGYAIGDNMFVVEFGGDRILHHPLVWRMVPNARAWRLANRMRVAHWFATRLGGRMRMRLGPRLREMRRKA